MFSQPAVERFARSLFRLRPRYRTSNTSNGWSGKRRYERMHASPDGHRPGWQSWRRKWKSGQTIRLDGCAFGRLPKSQRAHFYLQLRPLSAPRRAFNLRPHQSPPQSNSGRATTWPHRLYSRQFAGGLSFKDHDEAAEGAGPVPGWLI